MDKMAVLETKFVKCKKCKSYGSAVISEENGKLSYSIQCACGYKKKKKYKK